MIVKIIHVDFVLNFFNGYLCRASYLVFYYHMHYQYCYTSHWWHFLSENNRWCRQFFFGEYSLYYIGGKTLDLLVVKKCQRVHYLFELSVLTNRPSIKCIFSVFIETIYTKWPIFGAYAARTFPKNRSPLSSYLTSVSLVIIFSSELS